MLVGVGKSLMAAVNLSSGRTSVGVTVNPAKRNLAGEGDAVPCANIEPLGCLMECLRDVGRPDERVVYTLGLRHHVGDEGVVAGGISVTGALWCRNLPHGVINVVKCLSSSLSATEW